MVGRGSLCNGLDIGARERRLKGVAAAGYVRGLALETVHDTAFFTFSLPTHKSLFHSFEHMSAGELLLKF